MKELISEVDRDALQITSLEKKKKKKRSRDSLKINYTAAEGVLYHSTILLRILVRYAKFLPFSSIKLAVWYSADVEKYKSPMCIKLQYGSRSRMQFHKQIFISVR